MKKYVAPDLQIVELRAEECIAMFRICDGLCTEDVTYGGVTYYALGS